MIVFGSFGLVNTGQVKQITDVPLVRKACSRAEVSIIYARKTAILLHFGNNGFYLIVGNCIGKQFCNHSLPDDGKIICLGKCKAGEEHQKGKKCG
jgi:hypothetical protein